jgi:hypothetical protein
MDGYMEEGIASCCIIRSIASAIASSPLAWNGGNHVTFPRAIAGEACAKPYGSCPVGGVPPYVSVYAALPPGAYIAAPSAGSP